MKRTALIIATLCGLASALLLLRYQDRFARRVRGGELVPVLVVNRSIGIGETLSSGDLALRDLPRAYLEERHIRGRDSDRVIGIRTTTAIQASEALLWTDLAVSENEERVLSALVRSGMRAVSVDFSGDAGFGGMLRPGDRIDVLLRRQNEREEALVVPLLQNVLVLSSGAPLGQDLLQSIRSPGRLTLSVTAAQSKTLALAQAEGSLIATLRNPDDLIIDESGATLSRDLSSAQGSVQPSATRLPSSRSTKNAPRMEIEHVR